MASSNAAKITKHRHTDGYYVRRPCAIITLNKEFLGASAVFVGLASGGVRPYWPEMVYCPVRWPLGQLVVHYIGRWPYWLI